MHPRFQLRHIRARALDRSATSLVSCLGCSSCVFASAFFLSQARSLLSPTRLCVSGPLPTSSASSPLSPLTHSLLCLRCEPHVHSDFRNFTNFILPSVWTALSSEYCLAWSLFLQVSVQCYFLPGSLSKPCPVSFFCIPFITLGMIYLLVLVFISLPFH